MFSVRILRGGLYGTSRGYISLSRRDIRPRPTSSAEFFGYRTDKGLDHHGLGIGNRFKCVGAARLVRNTFFQLGQVVIQVNVELILLPKKCQSRFSAAYLPPCAVEIEEHTPWDQSETLNSLPHQNCQPRFENYLYLLWW